MAKQPNELQLNNIKLTIEEGTTIIVNEVKYSGTVIVEQAIAETLKQTGKAYENGSSTNA